LFGHDGLNFRLRNPTFFYITHWTNRKFEGSSALALEHNRCAGIMT